jgi:hypothetical protein
MPKKNLYTYNGVHDLTSFELFFHIAADVAADQLGMHFSAAAMVVSGRPYVPTRKKFRGSTEDTSIASITARKAFNYKLDRAVLPTWTDKSRRAILVNNVGKFVGRSTPLVGYFMIGVDAGMIAGRTIARYNMMVRPEDEIF